MGEYNNGGFDPMRLRGSADAAGSGGTGDGGGAGSGGTGDGERRLGGAMSLDQLRAMAARVNAEADRLAALAAGAAGGVAPDQGSSEGSGAADSDVSDSDEGASEEPISEEDERKLQRIDLLIQLGEANMRGDVAEADRINDALDALDDDEPTPAAAVAAAPTVTPSPAVATPAAPAVVAPASPAVTLTVVPGAPAVVPTGGPPTIPPAATPLPIITPGPATVATTLPRGAAIPPGVGGAGTAGPIGVETASQKVERRSVYTWEGASAAWDYAEAYNLLQPKQIALLRIVNDQTLFLDLMVNGIIRPADHPQVNYDVAVINSTAGTPIAPINIDSPTENDVTELNKRYGRLKDMIMKDLFPTLISQQQGTDNQDISTRYSSLKHKIERDIDTLSGQLNPGAETADSNVEVKKLGAMRGFIDEEITARVGVDSTDRRKTKGKVAKPFALVLKEDLMATFTKYDKITQTFISTRGTLKGGEIESPSGADVGEIQWLASKEPNLILARTFLMTAFKRMLRESDGVITDRFGEKNKRGLFEAEQRAYVQLLAVLINRAIQDNNNEPLSEITKKMLQDQAVNTVMMATGMCFILGDIRSVVAKDARPLGKIIGPRGHREYKQDYSHPMGFAKALQSILMKMRPFTDEKWGVDDHPDAIWAAPILRRVGLGRKFVQSLGLGSHDGLKVWSEKLLQAEFNGRTDDVRAFDVHAMPVKEIASLALDAYLARGGWRLEQMELVYVSGYMAESERQYPLDGTETETQIKQKTYKRHEYVMHKILAFQGNLSVLTHLDNRGKRFVDIAKNGIFLNGSTSEDGECRRLYEAYIAAQEKYEAATGREFSARGTNLGGLESLLELKTEFDEAGEDLKQYMLAQLVFKTELGMFPTSATLLEHLRRTPYGEATVQDHMTDFVAYTLHADLIQGGNTTHPFVIDKLAGIYSDAVELVARIVFNTKRKDPAFTPYDLSWADFQPYIDNGVLSDSFITTRLDLIGIITGEFDQTARSVIQTNFSRNLRRYFNEMQGYIHTPNRYRIATNPTDADRQTLADRFAEQYRYSWTDVKNILSFNMNFADLEIQQAGEGAAGRTQNDYGDYEKYWDDIGKVVLEKTKEFITSKPDELAQASENLGKAVADATAGLYEMDSGNAIWVRFMIGQALLYLLSADYAEMAPGTGMITSYTRRYTKGRVPNILEQFYEVEAPNLINDDHEIAIFVEGYAKGAGLSMIPYETKVRKAPIQGVAQTNRPGVWKIGQKIDDMVARGRVKSRIAQELLGTARTYELTSYSQEHLLAILGTSRTGRFVSRGIRGAANVIGTVVNTGKTSAGKE